MECSQNELLAAQSYELECEKKGRIDQNLIGKVQSIRHWKIYNVSFSISWTRNHGEKNLKNTVTYVNFLLKTQASKEAEKY